MSCVKSSIMDIKGFLDWDCHPILFRRYHNETFCCYEAKDSYFIQPREDRVPSHYIFSFEVKADFYRLKKEISWQSFAFSLSSTVPGFCRECFRHKSSHSTKKMRERENYCHANFFFPFQKKICPRGFLNSYSCSFFGGLNSNDTLLLPAGTLCTLWRCSTWDGQLDLTTTCGGPCLT